MKANKKQYHASPTKKPHHASTHNDYHELLEQLYVEHRDYLTAYVKKCFPLRSWEQCQDDVQEFFLVLAVDGFGRLGEISLSRIKKHLKQLVFKKMRELKCIKRGGHIRWASFEVADSCREDDSSDATAQQLAVQELEFSINQFDTSVLTKKEMAIMAVVLSSLPESLSARQILDQLPDEVRSTFFSKKPVADPTYHACREVTRRLASLRKQLRQFFYRKNGQSDPVDA